MLEQTLLVKLTHRDILISEAVACIHGYSYSYSTPTAIHAYYSYSNTAPLV